jgi:hypothetical protein
MKQQLRRLGVAACSAVVLMAVPAGAQAAAVLATTGPGIPVTPEAAYLTGAIDTAFGPSVWLFQYGTTTSYGKSTPLETLAAGTGERVVFWPLSGLKPGTVYHFRLAARAAVSGSYGYYYPASGIGADQTFKTAGAGTIKLASTKLKVKKSKVSLGLTCSSTIACKGKYSATVRGKVKGKTRTVSCFSGRFSLKAGAKGRFDPRVSKTCLSLFRHKKLKGVTLTVTTTTYQPKLVRKVTLTK